MGYMVLMKDRLVSNVRAFGSSFRTMLKARKMLAKPKNAIFLVLMALPIVSVIFINNPIAALTWLIALFIYLPILDAYAYAVVYGGSR